MIHLPYINPDMFVIAGMIHVRWYGFMYLLGFVSAWFIGRDRGHQLGLHHNVLLDYFSYVAFGILIGGRLGYMVIYQLPLFMESPWTLFTIWKGGMAFHGALLGGLIALILFCRSRQLSVLNMIDFTMPLVPPGLFFGRFGNFINGELWGRVSYLPWAMVFPRSDGFPRHPSQIYEMFGEGLLLYFLMNWHRRCPDRSPGMLGAWFIFHYGWIRFVIEFYREPDHHLGFVAYNYLSMGQCLCAIMVCAGLLWLWVARRQHVLPPAEMLSSI